MKLFERIRLWKTRSKSIDGKCRFYFSCEFCQKEGKTCLNEAEASSGYCGIYEINEVKERLR